MSFPLRPPQELEPDAMIRDVADCVRHSSLIMSVAFDGAAPSTHFPCAVHPVQAQETSSFPLSSALVTAVHEVLAETETETETETGTGTGTGTKSTLA
jgi:hypothetical protein